MRSSARRLLPEGVDTDKTWELWFLGLARDFESAMDTLEDMQRRLERHRGNKGTGVGRPRARFSRPWATAPERR
jgi:hypothetical protein